VLVLNVMTWRGEFAHAVERIDLAVVAAEVVPEQVAERWFAAEG
jgi:hypothetical protein